MKVNQADPQFRPVILELETYEEFVFMRTVLNLARHSTAFTIENRSIAENMYTLLLRYTHS